MVGTISQSETSKQWQTPALQVHGGVRGGSECKKIIVWRGARRVCVEGLSAKRSLRGGVRRGSECKKVIARRGARRV